MGEAAQRLAQLLNREAFVSPRGQTRHTTWLRLCRLLSEHPAEVSGKLRAEAIIRGGLREFSDEVGHIWVSLADFFIRQAQFEQARDVYEEAVSSVMTVRDFSMAFDGYAQYEESMITAALGALTELEARAAAAEGGAAAELAERLAEAQADLDIRLARLERLTERRPELLSSVLLRQNPHCVKEWLRRVGLFKADPARAIHTFATAVKTVSPEHATHGKLASLWIAFAGYYEKHGDVRNARTILAKAADVQFRSADELASVWLERAELELRCKAYGAALELLREATTPPPPAQRSKKALEGAPVRHGLFRVTKLWALYADLEESVGSVESAKRAYEQMFALKVITPQLVLSMAAFLEEKGFFEQSFQAFERGVATFAYPWALELWRAYLHKFCGRYGGTKLERTRDLYEQALDKCPPESSAEFWRAYALFELEHGLARHAMGLFARGCDAVAPAAKAELFRLHIAKASETFGVAKTRPIYERAIELLPDEAARLFCLEYAQLETKLGEVRPRSSRGDAPAPRGCGHARGARGLLAPGCAHFHSLTSSPLAPPAPRRRPSPTCPRPSSRAGRARTRAVHARGANVRPEERGEAVGAVERLRGGVRERGLVPGHAARQARGQGAVRCGGRGDGERPGGAWRRRRRRRGGRRRGRRVHPERQLGRHPARLRLQEGAARPRLLPRRARRALAAARARERRRHARARAGGSSARARGGGARARREARRSARCGYAACPSPGFPTSCAIPPSAHVLTGPFPSPSSPWARCRGGCHAEARAGRGLRLGRRARREARRRGCADGCARALQACEMSARVRGPDGCVRLYDKVDVSHKSRRLSGTMTS